MPTFDDIDLPYVTVTGDPEETAAKLAEKKMPVEAMVELAIYAKRQAARAKGFEAIEAAMKDRILAAYGKRKSEDRETIRTDVGMVTYTEAGEKVELKDRDFTVANLTPEQLRISYKPDLKNLETILKKDEFERHVKRVPVDAKVSLRDSPKSDDFSEIDFD